MSNKHNVILIKAEVAYLRAEENVPIVKEFKNN